MAELKSYEELEAYRDKVLKGIEQRHTMLHDALVSLNETLNDTSDAVTKNTALLDQIRAELDAI